MGKIHTRENMSPELKRELDLIEQHEEAMRVREYLDGAMESSAYLYATRKSPFEVEFYWDEPEFGSIAKVDLRADLLEVFSDDPEHYKDKIAEFEKAYRAFSDELAAMLKGVA